MKLPMKLAGMFGSGVFILTAIPGFYQHIKPTSLDAMVYESLPGMDIIETVAISLLGSLLAGCIGYTIGDILSKPAGNKQRQRKKGKVSKGRSPVPSLKPVTGEETYLEDLEAPTPSLHAAEAMPMELSPADET